MSKRIFSVITICRNNPAELRKTLTSFLGLDFDLIETVVVDGSSGTDCAAVAAELAAETSRYVHRPGCGLYEAMNIGIETASGNAFLFVNSGDALYDPQRINRLVVEHRTHLRDKVLYGAHVQEIRGQRFLIDAPALRQRAVPRRLPSHQAIILPAIFCRANKYDGDLHFLADVVLMSRALGACEHIRIDEPLAIVVHGGRSTMPQNWRSVLQHCYETLAVCDHGVREHLIVLRGYAPAKSWRRPWAAMLSRECS